MPDGINRPGPNRGDAYVQANATFFGTNCSGTIASNAISVAVNAAGGGLTNINVSGGTTSNYLSNLVFADGSGVSWGLNGSTITASVAAGGGLSNINVSGGTTSSNLSALKFIDSQGVSWSLDTGSKIYAMVRTDYQSAGAYLTTAALSGDTSKYAGIGESVGTVAGTDLALTVNTDGVSILYPKWLTTAMLSNAATISNINVSGGTTSSNLSALKFIDSQGVSWSLDTGSKIYATVKTDYQSAGAYLTTAMLSNAATISNINVSGGTTSSNLSAFKFIDSQGVSWSLDTGSKVYATVKTDYLTTAMQSGASTQFVQANAVFNGTNASGTIASNAISVSVAAAGGGTPASWFDNLMYVQGSQTLSVQGSTSHIAPFMLPYDISVSYLRLMMSANVPGTSTIATTNAATGSCSIASTIFAVVYVQNTGASSQSLKSYASGSVGFTQRWSLSANATAGSQWTLSKTCSFVNTTGATSFTTQSVASTSNINLASDDLTVMTGLKAMEIPFATSLAAGNYWMMVGISSSSATGGSGTLTRLNMSVSNVCVSQSGFALGHWGNNTNASVHLQPGLGSFSTNAIGTTASLGYSNVSTSLSNNMAWWQFHRTT